MTSCSETSRTLKKPDERAAPMYLPTKTLFPPRRNADGKQQGQHQQQLDHDYLLQGVVKQRDPHREKGAEGSWTQVALAILRTSRT